jgi:hypothetical protein
MQVIQKLLLVATLLLVSGCSVTGETRPNEIHVEMMSNSS